MKFCRPGFSRDETCGSFAIRVAYASPEHGNAGQVRIVNSVSMQSFSMNQSLLLHRSGSRLPQPTCNTICRRLRAPSVIQAGLFGLNFGTVSATEIKSQKDEVLCHLGAKTCIAQLLLCRPCVDISLPPHVSECSDACAVAVSPPAVAAWSNSHRAGSTES